MAHNTGSLNVQSYDGKLPSEIYEQYMVGWGEVNLVPESVNLEKRSISLLIICRKSFLFYLFSESLFRSL
jgi:hypothetical protein